MSTRWRAKQDDGNASSARSARSLQPFLESLRNVKFSGKDSPNRSTEEKEQSDTLLSTIESATSRPTEQESKGKSCDRKRDLKAAANAQRFVLRSQNQQSPRLAPYAEWYRPMGRTRLPGHDRPKSISAEEIYGRPPQDDPSNRVGANVPVSSEKLFRDPQREKAIRKAVMQILK